jgi:hypothetical protein
MDTDFDRQQLAREAKAIVALAFRNGPIENINSGRHCPNCADQPGYPRMTDEMKLIMKTAVVSRLRPPLPEARKTKEYESRIKFEEQYIVTSDEAQHAGRPPPTTI